jgi:hypothetical protein
MKFRQFMLEALDIKSGLTMPSNTVIDLIRGWLPFTATGPSTLRGYPSGTLSTVRSHLSKVTLDEIRGFAGSDKDSFRDRLNHHTSNLSVQFLGPPNWGAARKVFNIYLRNVLYNKYMMELIPFDLCESYLEVPLDSVVANRIRKESDQTKLTRWTNLISLELQMSDAYQSVASLIATRQNLSRVHLDLILGPDKPSATTI